MLIVASKLQTRCCRKDGRDSTSDPERDCVGDTIACAPSRAAPDGDRRKVVDCDELSDARSGSAAWREIHVSESSRSVVYRGVGAWSGARMSRRDGWRGGVFTLGKRILVVDSYGVPHRLRDDGSAQFAWP